MSLQDQRRYLETIERLTEEDRAAGVLVVDVEDALQRKAGDLRTPHRLAALWQSEYIVLSADESSVAITAKGLWAVGKGERPAQSFLGSRQNSSS